MPTFLFNLRLDDGYLPYIASASIVDPIVVGYRGVIRRFPDGAAVMEALEAAGISAERYQPAVSEASSSRTASFEIDLNEAQKLSIIQIDTTE